MEEGDEGSFEFRSSSSVDSSRRESLPHNRFANVGCNEQVDSTSESVTFLEEFVEEDDDQGGNDELED